MSGQAPTFKPTTLIVLAAFDRGEDGELYPAFEPREVLSEERAVRQARELATRYASVIVWTRHVRADEGEYGEPVVVFQRGSLPAME